MPRTTGNRSILATIGLVAFLSLPMLASAQPTLPQSPTIANSQHPPIPIEHLYWYFMLYQNHLDTKAAGLGSHAATGNPLQKALGWSDADFAQVRNSANRIAGKAAAYRQHTLLVHTAAPSNRVSQMRALQAQRIADIDTEMATLKQSLPPGQYAYFEAFLIKLFVQSKIPQGTVVTGVSR